MRALLLVALLSACSRVDDSPSPDAAPTPPPSSTCGNGRLDDGEMCDGTELGGYTCANLSLGAGDLACRADCGGFDDSACVPDETTPPTCVAKTCTQLGLGCGTAADGCGHTLNCGTCTTPQPPPKWTQVAAGGEHTCALRDDHSVWCWGRNNFSQVGAGGTPFGYDARPIKLPTADDWYSIVSGDQHSCGIRGAGTAWCWGRGDSGQLGNMQTVSSGTPVQFKDPQDYTYEQLSAGAFHTCALRTGGGNRLCAGTTTGGFPSAAPSYTGSYFDDISSGGDDSCAITATGAVKCDVLGDHAVNNSTHSYTAVDAGQDFWCALATGGTLYCAGAGIWGQLGNGAELDSATPVQAGGSLYWVDVSAGGRHACGVTVDGTLYCWGANEAGQLGDTTTQRRDTPTYVGTGYVSVSAGTDHTCAIKTDGSLWCWGKGDYGRLGSNGTGNATSPKQVVE
jgi:alpha-tubulin suppressor-like RCC1 family protein